MLDACVRLLVRVLEWRPTLAELRPFRPQASPCRASTIELWHNDEDSQEDLSGPHLVPSLEYTVRCRR